MKVPCKLLSLSACFQTQVSVRTNEKRLHVSCGSESAEYTEQLVFKPLGTRFCLKIRTALRLKFVVHALESQLAGIARAARTHINTGPAKAFLNGLSNT